MPLPPSTLDRPRIGISACFLHADPERPIFTGKTLQYVEQSIVHWVQSSGAFALMIPAPTGATQRGDVSVAHYADLLDGLLLEGGADMWPGSYGEDALKPQWHGDRVRDEYEIALLRAFVDRGKPVLGICRGLQVINVAFGGTLYQDIATQLPGAIEHRNARLYDRNFHTIAIAPGTRLAQLYPRPEASSDERDEYFVVNSVHHQGIKQLAPHFIVEARCPNDGVIEAIRYDNTRGTVQSYVAAVQWHPEFHDWTDPKLLSGDPLLADFLAAISSTSTQKA